MQEKKELRSRDAILRCLSGNYYGDDEPNLRCPVCGYDFSHIDEVFGRLGCDTLEGAADKVVVMKEVSAVERRAAVVVRIDGECGHRWQLVIQQHKGINWIAIEVLPDADAHDREKP